jgi:hypothetical protein
VRHSCLISVCFTDLYILSSLEGAPYHPHVTTRDRDRTFSSGPETLSLAHISGETMQASSCRSAAQRFTTSLLQRANGYVQPFPILRCLTLCDIIQRNVSGAEVRFEKEKARNAKNAKNTKNAPASSSRPPQSSVTQQSSGSGQAHPSSEPVFISSNTAGAGATSTITTSRPDAIIPRAGRWSRFWLFICCPSVQYTDSHN